MIQWGNAAEWAGSIATAMAVVTALLVAFRDSRFRSKLLVEEQASKISAWPVGRGSVTEVKILNASSQPIYEVVVSYGIAYGAGMTYMKGNEDQRFVLRTPPGEYFIPEPKNHGGGMHTQLGIAISFRDASGAYWRREATGKLIKVQTSTFKELEISEPVGDWVHPRLPEE